MNILIPNATGPTNIGDQAILKGLLGILRENYEDAHITIHTSNPELYSQKIADKINPHLYFWAAFSNRNTAVRSIRIFELFLQYVLCVFKISLPIGESRLLDIVDDYRKADLIIFAGGGYLRSKVGVTQTLNLLMVLFMFRFAQLFTVKKIVAPISFGPFAYKWQERLAVHVLRGFDIVSLRENISFTLLQKHQIGNIILSTDHALLIKAPEYPKVKSNEITIGFAIRNWLNGDKQKIFEKAIIDTLEQFSRGKNVIIQPIIQAVGRKFQENDSLPTVRIREALLERNMRVNEAKQIFDVDDALQTYNKLDLLLGMRMHSNIMAALMGTPFIAISYEHKSEGIVNDLGIAEYCIPCEKTNVNNLLILIQQLYERREVVKANMTQSLTALKKREWATWHTIFSQDIFSERPLVICYFGAYSETYSRNAINIRGLRENGAEIVFCRVGKPKFKSESRLSFIVALVLYPLTFPIRTLYSFFKGLFLYFRNDYDVILVGYQAHFDVPSAFLLAKILRKPLIFDAPESLYDVFVSDKKLIPKNSLFAKILFIVEKQIYNLCDAIFLDTTMNKAFFVNLFGINPAKVYATQIGSDNKIYRYYPPLKDFKKETFDVVFYGFQSPLHGLVHVIRAAEICKGDPSIQFFLVGGGQSYAENKALTEELGIHNVTFSTLTENTGAIEFLKTADVMLGFFANNPTGMRSIPNKALQGMAMKKPVLTAKGAGILGMFTHKKDIYLCEAENPTSIMQAIQELKSNTGLREKIAENGYTMYQKHFTPEAIGKTILGICREEIQKKNEK